MWRLKPSAFRPPSTSVKRFSPLAEDWRQSRRLATHHFALDDIMQAYDTFEHAAREGALKVILSNDARD